jgi:CxxC motif-containing protein (DUF1111 family)
MRSFLAVALFSALLLSCSDPQRLDPNSGGETTREDASLNSFGLPAPGLTNEQRRFFERGDSFFTQNWVTAPASTDARDGLGPLLNGASCSSCHVLDGRGAPPDPTGEQANLGLLMRVSLPGEDPVTGAPLPDLVYGGQIQDRSIQGIAAEAQIDIEWSPIEGTYADGAPWELRSPTYALSDLVYGPADPDLMISPRLAPQVFGMGLLQAIPDEALLELADPSDGDGDGISGRVNMVWDARLGQHVIGRFGWKANVATVEQQVAGAFLGDIGITSSLHPAESCTALQNECTEAPNGGSPELTDERLATVTFYNSTLAVPAMRDVDDDQVNQGARLFAEMGCASCHTQTMQTGVSDIDVLANQTIHAYTDLLLHDMGPGLADGRPDFNATGDEWRTPPLWGLGLIDEVNGQRFLLHDGRARTIDEAILWHGGEGQAANDMFQGLSADERAAVLAFLEAL